MPEVILWKHNRIRILPEVRRLMNCGPAGPAVAEVGVYTGQYAAALNKHLQPSRLVLIDAWRQFSDEVYDETKMTRRTPEKWAKIELNVRRKFSNFPYVEVVNDLSVAAATRFGSGVFDLVYIDANHSYEATAADIRAWWPKVKSGGFLAGHDYGWIKKEKAQFPGVRRAVREFSQSVGLDIHLTAEFNNASFFIHKP